LENFEVAVEKMVNPKIKVTHGQLMTAGDDCCEIFLEEIGTKIETKK